MARRKPRWRGSSPQLPECEWVDWCGHRIWVAGYTEGGAPYGVTEEEWQDQDPDDSCYGPPWARAQDVLARVFGKDVRAIVGRAQKLGHGLSSMAYAAHVDLVPDPADRSGPYVVLLAFEDERDPERDDEILRQARLLAYLSGQPLPFRLPEVIAVTREAYGLALVESHLPGLPLTSLAKTAQANQAPWITGQVAAAIHGCPTPPPEQLGEPMTRRAHALHHLQVFAELPRDREPVLAAAYEWGLAHLPADVPGVLLHGDLMGQNILWHPTEPPGVLDWSASRLGDPAYDLALVTRGARRPFGSMGGLELLLEAYRDSGGAEVTDSQVRLHELCLIAGWYCAAGQEQRGGQTPAFYADQMRGLLRRCIDQG